MIVLTVLSPQNELGVIERLRDDIARAWPHVAASVTDRVDLFAGVRTGMDVDLLVTIDIAEGSALPDATGRERGIEIRAGLIVIEIKQKDAQFFEVAGGNQLFPLENGRPATRSVTDQARDAMFGVLNFARQSVEHVPYGYSLAWLTEVDEMQLDGVDPRVLGRNATWGTILRAALMQHPQLARAEPIARAATRAVRSRLLARRPLTVLDRARAERIARDEARRRFVEGIAPDVGRKAIRLAGHGGSGKTTTLVLLAMRLATTREARVLILTFHHALCNDIRHAIQTSSDGGSLAGDAIVIDTTTNFLMALVTAAGQDLPTTRDGAIDYALLDRCYAETAAFLEHPAADLVTSLKRSDPARFEWDAVLIDESQDWHDGERDLLRAAYDHRTFVLADGLVQLIRRQQSCPWLRGIPKDERDVHDLGVALRQHRIVAEFSNAVAASLGFADWHVEPQPQLPGGRVIVLEGELPPAPALASEMRTIGAAASASPVDHIVCVPPSEVERGDGDTRHSRFAEALRAGRLAVWDGADPAARLTPPAAHETWRVVQYDSCRGLEGWVTLLVALDDLYAQKIRYPNPYDRDRPVDPSVVARRWLLIPLTRAVHTLIVHVRDARSPVTMALREAAASMPHGTVEWRTSHSS